MELQHTYVHLKTNLAHLSIESQLNCGVLEQAVGWVGKHCNSHVRYYVIITLCTTEQIFTVLLFRPFDFFFFSAVRFLFIRPSGYQSTTLPPSHQGWIKTTQLYLQHLLLLTQFRFVQITYEIIPFKFGSVFSLRAKLTGAQYKHRVLFTEDDNHRVILNQKHCVLV